MTVTFLKGHIDRVHHNIHSHICELCAKRFKSGKSYERHYITVHTNISQKVQCEMCGKWMKNKGSLKKHTIWHNSESATCKVNIKRQYNSPTKRHIVSIFRYVVEYRRIVQNYVHIYAVPIERRHWSVRYVEKCLRKRKC